MSAAGAGDSRDPTGPRECPAEDRDASVVLDTNVLIAAAFRPGSQSGALVDRVSAGSLRMIWSDATLGECRRMFQRIPPISWDEVAPLFRPEDRYEGPLDPDAFGQVPDPDDRKFVALAAAADAVLVSLDAHVLDAELEGVVRVLRPGEDLLDVRD